MATQTTPTHRDPVCGMQVDQNHAAGSSTHNGKKYCFCSSGYQAKFDRNSSDYVKTSSAS
jgi:Cu+-exporting ATPase